MAGGWSGQEVDIHINFEGEGRHFSPLTFLRQDHLPLTHADDKQLFIIGLPEQTRVMLSLFLTQKISNTRIPHLTMYSVNDSSALQRYFPLTPIFQLLCGSAGSQVILCGYVR